MHPSVPRPVIALLCLLTGQGAVANQPAETPLHEQVLAYLRNHHGVITTPLPDLHPRHTTFNAEAPIPPQCYTRHDGRHNPCYVCHQNQVPGRENAMNDGELQVDYAFSDVGLTNHWHNLFEDRTAAVAAISDAEILAWIDQDNYSALAPALSKAGFEGWIPDLADLQLGAAAFDTEGFAKDGSHWVAFNYKPFPSTFWPTNGSTDDVMIRLPEAFRTDASGVYSLDVYRANLAIVEATVKGLPEISALPFDERRVGADLDGDGQLGRVMRVTKVDAYVGAAAEVFLDTYLYPEGTEFLHTVRYIGIRADGEIVPSRRMKEVRYMRKWSAYTKRTYARHYELGGFEKEAGALPRPALVGDWGLDNGYGWSVHGFIEGVDGQLRTATYEENLFCMGCHSSIGATIDKTFAFPRKVDGADGWGYIDLRAMTDVPSMGETDGEILTYLARVGGGSEFRHNEEMAVRWFHADGTPNRDAILRAPDVYTLITPSRERALALNKAYRTIVAAQDYLYGRDATLVAPANVHREIDNETTQTLPLEHFHNWDIRLDWSRVSNVTRK